MYSLSTICLVITYAFFTLENNLDSSVEYSHEISQVIFNLNLCSDYYKLFNMNITQHHK